MFVLDEPSVGLHPRDLGRIVDVLAKLREYIAHRAERERNQVGLGVMALAEPTLRGLTGARDYFAPTLYPRLGVVGV